MPQARLNSVTTLSPLPAAGLIYYDLDDTVGALRSRLNVLFLQ